MFFSEKSHSAEKELSARKTTSQATISYESERVPFDQMKVSKNAQSQKKPEQIMIKY